MYYVLDENNNRIDAFDKEGVLAAINEAAANGSLDSIVNNEAFISRIKCCVAGGTFNFAFVTQAKYNELKASGNLKPNGYYIITDDTSADDINEAFEALTQTVNEHTQTVNEHTQTLGAFRRNLLNIEKTLNDITQEGTVYVQKAYDANHASSADYTNASLLLGVMEPSPHTDTSVRDLTLTIHGLYAVWGVGVSYGLIAYQYADVCTPIVFDGEYYRYLKFKSNGTVVAYRKLPDDIWEEEHSDYCISYYRFV